MLIMVYQRKQEGDEHKVGSAPRLLNKGKGREVAERTLKRQMSQASLVQAGSHFENKLSQVPSS